MTRDCRETRYRRMLDGRRSARCVRPDVGGRDRLVLELRSTANQTVAMSV
jgi:hypothetical protein